MSDSVRTFLFLQGPCCGYFSGVARKLKAAGQYVRRINLSACDELYWDLPEADRYRGNVSDWSAYIEAYLDEHEVTDLFCLGENRVYHKAAIEAAKARGIDVVVTDFGYFRPSWITLERNGMSGSSVFPRDPEAIMALAAECPEEEPEGPQYADSFTRLATQQVTGDCAPWLLTPLYPHYETHLLENPAAIYLSTGLRILRANLAARETRQRLESCLNEADSYPYFVFPLQMEGDFQIRAYSPYDSLCDAAGEILESFARHAPKETRLVVKVHPLDPDFVGWESWLESRAGRLGILPRLRFLDGGNLRQLLHHSQGCVTVNSTVGITALEVDRPLKILGQAVYDVPGLVESKPLDEFWADPSPPEPELKAAYLRALKACIQVRGNFFHPAGLELAIEETAARFLQQTVNRPFVHLNGVERT